jgi:hypothetical protein
MTQKTEEALNVGAWAVGRSGGTTMLRLTLADRPPIILAIPRHEAEKIADAIKAQGRPN